MFDAASLIDSGGLLILILAVYVQIGLFFCFFLPGGGLMFAAGLLIATGGFDHGIWTVCLLLTMAAMAGNATGYWFGRKAGPLLYDRPDSRFLKRRYLTAGEDFYRKYGTAALTIGVFFPIIRTFAPIVAGIIRLSFQRFFLFTTVGSAAYVICFVLAGYLIGIMPMLKPYLGYIVPIVILTVTLPIVIRIVRELREKNES